MGNIDELSYLTPNSKDTIKKLLDVEGGGGSGSFDLSDRIAAGTGINSIIVNTVNDSFAANNNTASGHYAIAEGGSTIASGSYSHTEGGGTKATNNMSHAEGSSTTASGLSSHAEGGNTTAGGSYSHAEGQSTTASGNNSHAEGWYSGARGDSSHAEGLMTNADGDYSHADGQGTAANGRSQHVFGEWNIPESSVSSSSNRGTYVEIVGNGSGLNSLSNARTLDWSGNEVLSGSITLGAGTQDETTITAAQLKALLELL